jgi:hypothetical protein
MRVCKVVVAGLMLVACSAAPAAGSARVPTTGKFSGRTSQPRPADSFGFWVAGTQITHTRMGWRAWCGSRQFFTGGTRQGTTRIVIRNGSWTSTGSYFHRIPSAPGYTAHVRIVESSGHFIDLRHARGTFHIKVQVLHNGRRVDTCDTGLVRWSTTKQR